MDRYKRFIFLLPGDVIYTDTQVVKQIERRRFVWQVKEEERDYKIERNERRKIKIEFEYIDNLKNYFVITLYGETFLGFKATMDRARLIVANDNIDKYIENNIRGYLRINANAFVSIKINNFRCRLAQFLKEEFEIDGFKYLQANLRQSISNRLK